MSEIKKGDRLWVVDNVELYEVEVTRVYARKFLTRAIERKNLRNEPKKMILTRIAAARTNISSNHLNAFLEAPRERISIKWTLSPIIEKCG